MQEASRNGAIYMPKKEFFISDGTSLYD